MSIVLLIGRIIFGGYFLYMGFNHFKNASGLAQYAASKNVPSPKLAVIGSGLLVFLGGLGVVLGFMPFYALLLIEVFLFFVTLNMHAFWNITDPNMKMMEQVNFMKNFALFGAALALMALSSNWPLSI